MPTKKKPAPKLHDKKPAKKSPSVTNVNLGELPAALVSVMESLHKIADGITYFVDQHVKEDNAELQKVAAFKEHQAEILRRAQEGADAANKPPEVEGQVVEHTEPTT